MALPKMWADYTARSSPHKLSKLPRRRFGFKPDNSLCRMPQGNTPLRSALPLTPPHSRGTPTPRNIRGGARPHGDGKLSEGQVPKRAVGAQQAAKLQMWISELKFEPHLFVDVQAVVDGDLDQALADSAYWAALIPPRRYGVPTGFEATPALPTRSGVPRANRTYLRFRSSADSHCRFGASGL